MGPQIKPTIRQSDISVYSTPLRDWLISLSGHPSKLYKSKNWTKKKAINDYCDSVGVMFSNLKAGTKGPHKNPKLRKISYATRLSPYVVAG